MLIVVLALVWFVTLWMIQVATFELCFVCGLVACVWFGVWFVIMVIAAGVCGC